MNLAKLLVAIGATTGGFQRAMSAAERRVDALEKRTSGLRRGFGRATGAMGDFAKKAVFLGAVVLTALAVALGGVVSASIQYEDAFAGIRKTVEATEPELLQLSKDIRQMSTEIPIAATELAALGETAGALGVKTADIKEFIRVTALLGVTTDVTAQQAADSLGILSNVLGLTSEDYSRFGSALVALGNAGASTESQIIQIAERSGAAAKLIGLSTAQILGFASTIASIGMEPEAGGTALQTFFTKSLKFVSKGGKQLQILAKAAGMTGKEFKRAFEKDAGGALLTFFQGMNKLTSAERLAVLEALGFNDVRISRALLGLSDNSEELARQLGVSGDAWERNSALTEEAEKRFATTKSQLGLLKNILFDIAITLGDALLPVITPLIKGLNDWISANRDLIAQFAGQLAAGVQALVAGISAWVTENRPLIDQLMRIGGELLVAFWTILTEHVIPALVTMANWVVTSVVPALKSIARWIGDNVIPKVQAFIDTLTKPGGVIESILKVAGPVISSLITGFGFIVTALFGGGGGGHNGRVGAKKGLIPAIGDLVGVLWDDGEGALGWIVKKVGWLFRHVLAPALAFVIDKIATLIGWIATAIKELGKLGDAIRANHSGGFDPIGEFFGVTPQASGGPFQAGGISLVGEEGPELVKWGGSGYVTPADLSAASMAGAGGDGGGSTYHVTVNNPEPRAADDDIGRMLRRLEGLGITGARLGWSPT